MKGLLLKIMQMSSEVNIVTSEVSMPLMSASMVASQVSMVKGENLITF